MNGHSRTYPADTKFEQVAEDMGCTTRTLREAIGAGLVTVRTTDGGAVEFDASRLSSGRCPHCGR